MTFFIWFRDLMQISIDLDGSLNNMSGETINLEYVLWRKYFCEVKGENSFTWSG